MPQGDKNTLYSEYLHQPKSKHHFDELSNQIIGVAIEEHKELAPGFLEGIYEAALKVQLTERRIPFENQY